MQNWSCWYWAWRDGNVVLIEDSNGRGNLYAHLIVYLLELVKGQEGHDYRQTRLTGNSTGSHLHFLK